MGALTDAAKRANAATDKSMARVSRALQQFVNSANVGAGTALKVSGIRIMREVERRSPVDTGRFRAGWTAGFAALGVSPEPIPPISRTTGKPTSPAATTRGRSEGRGSFTEGVGRYEFIARNGVRYGPFLETGLVGVQARGGIVRPSLIHERQRLKKEIGQIRTKGTK